MKKVLNFKYSIKNKLIFNFVSLIVISLLLMGIITYAIVVNQTKNDYTNFIHKEISHVNDGIENYLELIQQNTRMVSQSSLIQQADSRITSYVEKKDASGKVQMTPLENNSYEAEVYNTFKNFKDSHPEISSISLGVESNGGYVQYPASARTNGYDARERDWYKLALEHPDKPILSDVYISSDGSKSIISISAIKDSTGAIKGVITMNINLDELTKIIENIEIGKNGYIVLVDKNGTMLANPKDTSLVSKKVEELNISKLDITNNNNTSFETKMPDGNNYSISVQKQSNSNLSLNWTYICFVETSEFMSSARSIGMVTILFIVIFSILSIAITIFIARKIANPISNIASHLQLMGNGDFSVEMDSKYLKINDEVGEIAKSTKTMQSSLKEMLSIIQNHSNGINNKAENLHDAAESVSNSSGEVANAIQEVAKGTDEQAHNLINATNILSNFATAIEIMTKTLTDIQEKTNSINKTASEGNDNMSGLVLSVKSVDVTFKEFGEKLSLLGQNVNKVNEITNLIDSIAEQTNLLALNAAIEASRAGESGKGFAVVADEIRKLAEQSKNSADEIAHLLGSITNDTSSILKNSDNMKIELNNQLTGINSTIKSFKEIVGEVENVIPKINNANSSAENINKEKDNILSKVENISAISQETSASSEEIAASSEEMSATAENLFSTVENLRDMAKDMIKQVNNFKL
ncbi:methyl-accepting chemotaxis protein McpB [Clostridium saccharobutylicum]|uniref:methyl-accepting chemotaxis protein n=1 Tax=Clostridium saccharobutylicum TaxID=169679 RepID=UPI000983CC37|nr:methyl-accepting chemotaxis protein [Clostridium saccharobutylicum]AQS08865.1 methyl-accepting chemotaxis protein McpB [Clostridium saccharobutylicum]MBC2437788.1 methyl-accepting chemotaxis protein [Clostridium saccharobutylicum]NSB90214.1 methyl-accepting chemotaxis protein [Clostridium saccharobutylicum]NYC28786.1 methyl-accepting chemotaxis protein [Clostridium saccharobutylicum]OOM14746.1 methyl-accepting chemotaxis protein McpB [Clostridium saccharobutylicum]